ncbi:olfactory receptor 2AP1-like [Gracilinanus agilis]|uniref:olfactory receptor 2AP1-like n=1 Tax=Gracilinanus agilis TaxID=191870 RepID=UPI001CFDC1DF|nr:olfactory receptor 2AP1-like [Gracilinanus agilis]
MGNKTRITEFVLQGLTDIEELQMVVFLLLLLAYLITISGNLIIITLTLLDSRLQTPMYFFLRNLSCLEIWFQTVIVPKMLVNIATGTKTISFAGCITQDFFHIFLGATEFFLLTAMSYDRYIAICKPLHYPTLMSSKICTQLTLTCWLAGFSFIIVPLVLTSQLPFCDSHINHFFCDYTPLMEVVCSGPKILEMVDFTLALVALLSTLVLITLSYVQIIRTIIKIPSAQERKKAFSTCSSHAIVVSMCYGSCFFMYVKPSPGKGVDLNKGVSLINTIIAPLMNPFIYTLRNQQVKQVVKDLLKKFSRLQNR